MRMREPRHEAHMERDGRRICIRLLRDEIKYDVDYDTWKRGQQAEEPNHRFEMQTDEENADWMQRRITRAVSDIRKKLRAYVKERGRMVTDELEDCDEWVISLVMEDGWMGDVDNLCVLMHQYVVDCVLRDWYGLTSGDLAQEYGMRAEADMDDMVDVAREVDLEGVRFCL